MVPTICGGMLAEEPGLAKTVETIALILMNPAQPSWNPMLTRSDLQGRADINPVRVCCVLSRFSFPADAFFLVDSHCYATCLGVSVDSGAS